MATEDTKAELEKLATVIYDEVCRVFNEKTGGNQQTRCTLSEQSEAVRQAYFRGAVVASTLVFNRLVNESVSIDSHERSAVEQRRAKY